MRKKEEKKKKRKESNPELDIIFLNGEEEILPKKKTKRKKTSNKEFIRITYLFVIVFIVMMGYLVYFNLVKSKDIINSPYNVRLDSMAERVVRGKILDRNGVILAETNIDENGTEKRVYPYNNLFSHVVGYDSNGKSGIESIANFELLTSNAFFLEKLMKEFWEEKNIGDNVVTTLDLDIQQAAYDALGKYNGAVLVMQPSTCKILAMVSKPDFNPNLIEEEWTSITESSESVLVNRATQGAYAPGSIFKLVTTLAYMRENSAYSVYNYECTGEIEYHGTVIHCAKNRKHGQEDLGQSLANSCNTSYSNLGLLLNIKKFRATAEELLFNCELPEVLPYRQSQFELNEGTADYEIMMTAIGQGKTQVSPYHMALITCAIANGGILMKPYLVDSVLSYTGVEVKKQMPEKYATLMDSNEAFQLQEYMLKVVESGTATSLKNDKYTVAGKTGTAEYSSDKEKAHSWFIGFTNIDNPEYVISVVVESADNSGMSAVSVAKKVLNACYE